MRHANPLGATETHVIDRPQFDEARTKEIASMENRQTEIQNGKQSTGKIERRSKLVSAAKELVWLDRETTAAYIGIGRTHLDALDPVLKPSKLGRRKIYNRQRVNEYLDRCAGIKPQQPPLEPAKQQRVKEMNQS